jgi:hypothetical protein
VIDPSGGRRGIGRSEDPEITAATRNRAAELGHRELGGEVLVVDTAAHAALRRVFTTLALRRDGAEPTVAIAVQDEPARANTVRGLVA